MLSLMKHLPDLKVAGIQELPWLLENWSPDFVISISDTKQEAGQRLQEFRQAAVPFCTAMHFHDIDRLVEGCIAPALPAFKTLLADLDDASVIGFDRLLVHCHAGISRSSATALLALGHLASEQGRIDDKTAEAIVAMVHDQHEFIDPNPRIRSMLPRLVERRFGAMIRDLSIARSEKNPTAINPLDLF